MAPFPFLLANRGRLTQVTVHEAIHGWLSGHGGFENVHYPAGENQQDEETASEIRREEVHADVDPAVAFGLDSESTCRLEVQFEFPPSADHDYYRIQWIDSNRGYSVGWHQDDHRDNLGECHLQLDHGDNVADTCSADFLDAHPLNVLETRLNHLPTVLDRIEWSNGSPEFDGEIYTCEIGDGSSLTLNQPLR